MKHRIRKGQIAKRIHRKSIRRGTVRGGISMSNRNATKHLPQRLQALGLW